MTITELIDYLNEWVKAYPDIVNMSVVCTNSVKFENELHEIDDAVVVDDNGVEKFLLW